MIVTTADRVVQPNSQLALARAIPGAQIYWVSGDHGVAAYRPEMFTPALITACLSVAGEVERQPPTAVSRP